MTIVQAYNYFTNYPNDRRRVRFAVNIFSWGSKAALTSCSLGRVHAVCLWFLSTSYELSIPQGFRFAIVSAYRLLCLLLLGSLSYSSMRVSIHSQSAISGTAIWKPNSTWYCYSVRLPHNHFSYSLINSQQANVGRMHDIDGDYPSVRFLFPSFERVCGLCNRLSAPSYISRTS